MIEVRHLRLLQALAAEGSMSKAAKRLGTTQSAVTQAVKLLEEQLATPLLVRTHAGIRLTDAGAVFVRHGEQILTQMAQVEAEVAAVAGLRAGTVRIACFPSAAATILPRALGRVTRSHPQLRFTLTEAEPPRALQLLRRGECDIAVVYVYAADSDQELGTGAPVPVLQSDEVAVPLVTEHLHVGMPAGHPAAAATSVDVHELAGERWIAGCVECRGNLLSLCSAAGFQPEIGFETDDYVALQALVAAGLGVALVPDLMLAAVRPDPGLAVRRLVPVTARVVSSVTTESLASVPAVRVTSEALVEAAAEVREAIDVSFA
ncbi:MULTISPECIES: LysR family transcriptional regulator [Actinoplanes]|uniref:LysR family transcriptional regulator n=1 Tax=Actinoplanes TaxID=1865 RepID=UPI0005F2F0AF|nr:MULTISPECIES: LysR family transcriptional regulator [Actinoplanes]